MRTGNGENDSPQAKARRGRAVLVGYGLDEADGHVRYTTSKDYRLLGGSEVTHEAMQDMANRIKKELSKLGYELDDIRSDQIDEIRRIVDGVVERVICE
jgi:hypothetical protein